MYDNLEGARRIDGGCLDISSARQSRQRAGK
jgi:hypothetical protein